MTCSRLLCCFLQHENNKLKEDLKAAVDDNPSHEGAKILVEQLRKREEELDRELLAKNHELNAMKMTYEGKVKALDSLVKAKDEELKKKELQYGMFLYSLTSLSHFLYCKVVLTIIMIV